jgi:hypothetical protein
LKKCVYALLLGDMTDCRLYFCNSGNLTEGNIEGFGACSGRSSDAFFELGPGFKSVDGGKSPGVRSVWEPSKGLDQ